jgi:hypothetical protein
MAVFDVTTSIDKLHFRPDSIHLEVLQNIKTILTTAKGSVPLDRDFGINTYLIDRPVSVIKPLLVKEIKEAIEKYEPRAKFQNIVWNGEIVEGKLYPVVKVVINTND